MSSVSLVGVTTPKIPGVTSAEELVAYAARVSNPSNQMNSETSRRLLRYLVNNKHWSPFEMVSVIMEINTTRDIARQILRHRSFSFQEFSQRYADASSLGLEYKEARWQDPKNRQNSIQLDSTNANDRETAGEWMTLQSRVADAAMDAYNWALNNNIAKEQARAVLPEGMTMSRLYMHGTLRSWIHYVQLRCEEGTQQEHREVALQCRGILMDEFPSIAAVILNEDS